ncbi:MAG: right-handed parallel beta-helix repeat-containing protein [bacterium]
MRTYLGLVALSAALTACGDSDGNLNNATCPAGYEQSGPACIPIFDDCPGPAEIPVLGGGCQAVGVTACATGLFEPDGEGGCEPILPDHSCPAGSMELLGQTECEPVGVTECAAGFESDGEGGCDAVLPPGPDPCPSGTIALLGYTTCQPLGDCGAGTWGNIVDDGVTVYVDRTADATGANGTAMAPFISIGEALAAVQTGGQIAVAAGDYTERLSINREVRLTGRCPALVTIRGTVFLGDPTPPVTVYSGGSGATIRGVTLTGPGEGLRIDGAQQVTVEQVQVLDASDVGIACGGEAEVSVQQVVVARCGTFGVYANGSTLDIRDSVVRDSRPEPSTSWFGRGIAAQCSSGGVCGSLRVSSCLVSGNRELGISASGVDADITATVVRDTVPEAGTGMGGAGIHAQCPTPETCGTLRVDSCLVSGNREIGISVAGVDAEVTSTVVRDTVPEGSTVPLCSGINAQCHESGVCGSVRVSSSLVTGNRGLGISVSGVQAEVHTTWVRDTLPEQSTGNFGRGISTQCDLSGVCGTLLVSSSLVTGNRGVGILANGADTEVNTTVVRDTLPDESTGEHGMGINAQCDDYGVCGGLLVSSSLVTGNREGGILVRSVVTEVNATVVRDTLPEESSGRFGRGIGAVCDAVGEGCGSLQVSSCVVSDNWEGGITAAGVDTEISSTVVRGTFVDELVGATSRGIGAQCNPELGVCGSLRVSSSLVTGNQGLGIAANGVDTEVHATVVRDTLPEYDTGKFGRGIAAECYIEVGPCGPLLVSSSLVSGNRDVGIDASGVDAEVISTVVRDTLPEEYSGSYGRGIGAQCYNELGACGSLRISSCVVQNNEDIGIFIAGRQATLQGVSVIDTRSNAFGVWRGIHGQGIWALCDERTGQCGDLAMTSCLVDSSQGAGVAVEGVSGFITSSVVRSVTSQPFDGKYGYGVQLGGLEGEALPVINLIDCEIRDAKLAGILYYRSGGTLSGSLVAGAENSVVMNEGSEPNILGNNDLSGIIEDAPTWASLYPAPAPEPSLPVE